MTGLPRKPNAYGESMFLRSRDPGDHRDFARLLPRMTPLFVYADDDGRDWVRWAMPAALVVELGWDVPPKCACCDVRAELGADDTVHFDTAFDETSWFFAERN